MRKTTIAKRSRQLFLLATLAVTILNSAVTTAAPATPAGDAAYVIHISVDGLGSSYLEKLIDDGRVPNFARLQKEGAWTHNARTDFDFTITLPNHTCMVTGRSVRDKLGSPMSTAGHNWVVNTDPGDKTLHGNRHDYVKSTFDVAHDHGLRTSLFPSKSKFVVYDQSYNAQNGAPDTVDDDNGRDKIDLYVKEGNSTALVDRFIAEMKANPFQYSFVHFHDADSAGHAKGWGSDDYNAAVVAVDGYLGRLLEMINGDDRLKGKTAIILSADHGGIKRDHFDSRNPLDYTIPFYIWGAGVAAGKDLYALNTDSRRDPGTARPDYNEGPQPIRNGDGGNLALKMLGLPAIPDSSINKAQDLKVR
jgi:predicted AlkP superfamily pyrophosphatase or phosphodiesterase